MHRYLASANDWRKFDVALFGSTEADDGEQSPLIIVDDALGAGGAHIELRDGVQLDPVSRTTAEGVLFNIETWAAGTSFPLRRELLLIENKDNDAALGALAATLTGLSNGGITLGMRKQPSYG